MRNLLNLGKTLSKVEQKQINGGRTTLDCWNPHEPLLANDQCNCVRQGGFWSCGKCDFEQLPGFYPSC